MELLYFCFGLLIFCCINNAFKNIQMIWYPGPCWPWRDCPHTQCLPITPRNSEGLLCKCAFHIQLTNKTQAHCSSALTTPGTGTIQAGTISMSEPTEIIQTSESSPWLSLLTCSFPAEVAQCSCPHSPLASSTPDWPFSSYMSPPYHYPPHGVSCPSSWGL